MSPHSARTHWQGNDCVCVCWCVCFSNCSDPGRETYTDTDISSTLFKLQVSNTHMHTRTQWRHSDAVLHQSKAQKYQNIYYSHNITLSPGIFVNFLSQTHIFWTLESTAAARSPSSVTLSNQSVSMVISAQSKVSTTTELPHSIWHSSPPPFDAFYAPSLVCWS